MPDATARSLSPRARVVASDEQVSAELSAETVILSMRDGHYYGLDGVGSRVWSLLAHPREFGDLVDTVVGEYEVERGTVEADLQALLLDLEARGLVTVDRPAA